MNRNVEFDSLQMGVTQVAGNRIADCLSSHVGNRSQTSDWEKRSLWRKN